MPIRWSVFTMRHSCPNDDFRRECWALNQKPSLFAGTICPELTKVLAIFFADKFNIAVSFVQSPSCTILASKFKLFTRVARCAIYVNIVPSLFSSRSRHPAHKLRVSSPCLHFISGTRTLSLGCISAFWGAARGRLRFASISSCPLLLGSRPFAISTTFRPRR